MNYTREETALASIYGGAAGIDLIVFLSKRKTHPMFAEIARSSRRVYPKRRRPRVDSEGDFRLREPEYPWRLHVLLPTPEAAPFIDELIRLEMLKPSRAELFISRHSLDPAGVQRWVDGHFLPRMARPDLGIRRPGRYRFYGERRRGPHLQYAVYSDRRCKLTGRRTTKIETRLIGAATIKAAGFRTAREMFAAAVSPEWWRRRLNLFAVDAERLGRLLAGVRHRRPDYLFRVDGNTFARSRDSLADLIADVDRLDARPDRRHLTQDRPEVPRTPSGARSTV